MRVGVIGPPDPDMFADNIADCLPDLGVEAVRLGTVRRLRGPGTARAVQMAAVRALPRLDTAMQRGTVSRALDAACDVVINIDRSLTPESVTRLRGGGASVVMWYPDALANLDQRMLSAPYDHLFLKDPLLAERLSSAYGMPATYLPEACNPRWHRPMGEPGSDGGVVAVGNLYSTRERLLARLYEDGVPLRLFGSGFPKVTAESPVTRLPVGAEVRREAKARVFREAAAVLNNLHPAEMGSLNCRLFEAAGSGGAVLCEDRPALRELFEPDEVLAFATYDELLAHARRLIDEPELTRKVGDAASARAHAEHTYQHRLRRILEEVG